MIKEKDFRMKKDVPYVSMLLLIVAGMVLGVIGVSEFNGNAITYAKNALPEETQIQDKDSEKSRPIASPLNWADVSEMAMPAVVSIYTTKEVEVRQQMDPFRFFFPDRRGQQESPDDTETIPQEGLGSGAVVSKDGYILTNNHVVGDVDEIRVMLTDKREFKAKLVGKDPLSDIALIKIDADNLTHLKLANSDRVRLGEPVLAIGSPLRLNSTVTSGIVSALGRNIGILRNSYGIESFIQTDAVINPGNSGGPLINTNGEIIGINTAIQTNTGYYQGYGFAVPANIAKNVMEELIQYGRVKRGYIGVQIRSVDAVMAKGLGLEKPMGVFVERVQENMPAATAGIRERDVILSVNGQSVNEPNELQAIISSYNPDDKVKLVIWRDKSEKEISVILKEREEDSQPVAMEESVKKESISKLGLEVTDLTARQKEVYELDKGVLITKVRRNSEAFSRGLREQMVIFEVNSEKVSNVSEFFEKMEDIMANEEVVIFKTKIRLNNSLAERLFFLEIPK
jgi:serine protease Do